MEFDLVVSGGRIVTAESSFQADLGIKGGRIVALATSLADSPSANRVDARDKLVAPGAIDVHTHFATNVGDGSTADDYESGSRAAAVGGITTFVNFAFQRHGQHLREATEAELKKAERQSHIDFGVHIVVTDLEPAGVLDEIGPLAEEGFTSLKLFTTIDEFRLRDEDILRVLARARDQRVMVNVHAEDDGLIKYRTAELLAHGDTEVAHLAAARPPEAEALATARIAAYAASLGTCVYFVHLSSALALDEVRRARSKGAQVFVETRPVYLFLDRSRYHLPNREGNKYVTWPPLRESPDQVALWEGLRNGEIQTYATDHTTWMTSQKMGPNLSFAQVPGGVSNVQTSIGMLYSEGVARGRLTENQFVAICSTNPAKLFGLWPAKGTLSVGADADVLVLDPAREFTIKSSVMQSRSDFDPYEGHKAVGWPSTVISRGEVIVNDGRIMSEPGRGKFLRRGRYRAV